MLCDPGTATLTAKMVTVSVFVAESLHMHKQFEARSNTYPWARTLFIIHERKGAVRWTLAAFFLVAATAYSRSSESDSQARIQALSGYLIAKAELESIFRRLEAAGFEPGAYTEEKFVQLAKAIREFQTKVNTQEPELLGPQTWSKLKKLYDAGGVELTEPINCLNGTATRSQKGKYREETYDYDALPSGLGLLIETVLSSNKYAIGERDGVIDATTRRSITRFDSKHNGVHYLQLKFRALAPGSDQEVSATDEVAAIKLSGRTWREIIIQALQKILILLGYDPGAANGEWTEGLESAIADYQEAHNMIPTGMIDDACSAVLILESCNQGCEFLIMKNPWQEPSVNLILVTDPEPSVPAAKTTKTESSNQAKLSAPEIKVNRTVAVKKSAVDFKNYPCKVKDKVYAVEVIECSDLSGDWIIFYTGAVVAKTAHHVSVKVEKRFGYRYLAKKEGINSHDWWCVPSRRHCYSEIGFKDWNGLRVKDDVVQFPVDLVYNEKIEIINAMSDCLRNHCQR